MSVCLLLGMMFIVVPLRKNKFYMMHLLIVTAASWFFESVYLKHMSVAFLINHWQKIFVYVVLFHLISINIVTFFAYGSDKKAAMRNLVRIPEKQLHALEFLGGWGGAIAGQRIFHHKNKKKEYQSFFWMLFIAEIILLYVILKYTHII